MTATAGLGPPPLSVAQEALWYASLLAPNRISYNETISIRKDGPFDAGAFRRAFNEVIRRHEAWRTTFDTSGGDPVQVLHEPPDFELPVLDLRHLRQEEAERRAVRVAADASRVPYDVRRGPLLRPRLVRFPGEHHRLYLAMHHLVFDGVSVYRVVLVELVALYDAFAAGLPSPLPEPATQYGDYARWEQEWVTRPRVARRLEHWRRRLADLPVVSLALDHPRPEAPRFRGGVLPLLVPMEAVDRLRDTGQAAGATLFQVLATTWAQLLGRRSGQQDVVFATAADLRQRPELEHVVGYCLTPLVLHVDLSGEPSFADLVVRVRNELLDGLDHLVPFERLVREVRPEAASNANPVYQTMIVLEPPTEAPDPSWSIHQMESAIGDAVGATKLDLELELDERPEGHIAGRLIYDRDLFEAETVARMAEEWLSLAGVAPEPVVPAASAPPAAAAADDERRSLAEWNATATGRRAGGVHDRFRERAARQPDAPAVAARGEAVTYGELGERAGAIARRLVAAGVRPGEVVAVCCEPSVDLIAGALAVLDAGAAHLLLDPRLPPERLDSMVAVSCATAVLAQPALAAKVTAPPARVLVLDGAGGDETDGPAAHSAPAEDALCCVHFTSTAAGDQAAVPIRHASVVNVAEALATELGLGPADTVLALPATLLELPVVELWAALLAGARVVVALIEAAADGARLSRLIASERVSFLHAPPDTWRALIDTGLRGARSLKALSSGAPLDDVLAGEILDRCRVLWNAYGAAETAGISTLAFVGRSAAVTLGRPIANTRAYVCDEALRPVPAGVAGELLIAGDGVASGYLERPDLTAKSFVDAPLGPGRAFRTGVRARWLPDGALEPAEPPAP